MFFYRFCKITYTQPRKERFDKVIMKLEWIVENFFLKSIKLKYFMEKKSVCGFVWQEKKLDQRLIDTIRQKFLLPEIISKIIANLQIPLEEIENFLDPKIKNTLPNPFDLLDMEKAVNHVIEAILKKKKITIFADYDVDGATSLAVLFRFFREIGVDAGIYVPDRILEGYGPNVEALRNLKKLGTDLVITVDCGTVAFEPLETAKSEGLDVIVIDHHIGVLKKPEAIAVINPNRIDERFVHKNICAAAVSFLFVVAINQKLRQKNFYLSYKEPNIFDLLDLVALGTVCDVMPLSGINRTFVTQGLKVLKKRKNLGLRKICDNLNLSEEPNSYTLGFLIGPRINAGGRIGTSNLGSKLLTSNDESEIDEIAKKLEDLNQQRKEIEKKYLQEAIENLEKKQNGFLLSDPILFAMSQNWHQGVIGIIASRLKDLYNKPAVVISIDPENGKGKASCRSIKGIDLGAEILNARSKNLLIEGGGHAMAGGFSIDIKNITKLHKFFCKNLGKNIEEIIQNKISEFDLSTDLEQLNLDILKQLSRLEPFGNGNPKPKFLLRNLQKIRSSLVGKNQEHISCVFASKSLIGFSKQIQAVLFNANNSALTETLLNQNFNKNVDLIGNISINNWMGNEKIQMIIEDILI
jgi:single-stranded-DNA-specific exonuclease